MRTTTIGQILREYREYSKYSLFKLAEKTKIREKYLQALESNDFEALPSATYARGYIRAYADLFGFDHQPLLAILRRDYSESARGQLVPAEFIAKKLKRRYWWMPLNFVVLGLGAIFLTLLLYVAVQWYNLQKPPYLAVISPGEDETVAAQVVIKGQTVLDALVLVNAKSVSVDAQGNFSEQVFLTREGLHTITIEATDRRGKKAVVQRTVKVDF